MEQIFLYARDSLPTTRKSTRQQPCVDEALQCVQMLVDTYGAELTDQVRELLPRLFGAEIGEPYGFAATWAAFSKDSGLRCPKVPSMILRTGLTRCLHAALRAIMGAMDQTPEIIQELRERLLDVVSKDLTGAGLHTALGSARTSATVLHVEPAPAAAVTHSGSRAPPIEEHGRKVERLSLA